MAFGPTINFGNGREAHFPTACRKLRELSAGCYDGAQMVDDAKPQPRKRYRHWSLFHEPSISYEKLGKRAEAGVCISCGKNPCECKNPRRKRH
jgi:hypothetical protein